MTKPTTIDLPEHQASFVEAQVLEGLYGSASEVVQAALRLLEEQEAKLTNLREALIEGENGGPGRPFDTDAFLARMHEEYSARR